MEHIKKPTQTDSSKTMNNPLDTLTKFESASAEVKGFIYSLPALKKSGFDVSRLPVSIRIVLESVLRNCDGKLAHLEDVKRLAAWNAQNPGDYEVPFVVSRIVLQDFTGVPQDYPRSEEHTSELQSLMRIGVCGVWV